MPKNILTVITGEECEMLKKKANNTINEYFCPWSLTNIFPYRKKNTRTRTRTLTCTILNETYIISVKHCQSMTSSNTTVSVSYHKIEHRERMYGLHSDHRIQLLWSLCFPTRTHTHPPSGYLSLKLWRTSNMSSCPVNILSLENLILQISQHLLPQFHSLNIED